MEIDSNNKNEKQKKRSNGTIILHNQIADNNTQKKTELECPGFRES
jgi:hypothetical protein